MNNIMNNLQNSIAVFKGLSKSGNSAKVILKRNQFEPTGIFCYLAGAPFKGMKKNDTLEVPAGWSLEEKADENGVVMTYEDGEAIKFATWKDS